MLRICPWLTAVVLGVVLAGCSDPNEVIREDSGNGADNGGEAVTATDTQEVDSGEAKARLAESKSETAEWSA